MLTFLGDADWDSGNYRPSQHASRPDHTQQFSPYGLVLEPCIDQQRTSGYECDTGGILHGT